MPDIIIATDTPHLYDEVRSVVEGPDTTVRWARTGQEVFKLADQKAPDIAVLDMQIGSMGGVAVAYDVRHDQGAKRLESFPMLLVLDRRADVFMARRCGVEGWILKPLDPIRIRRAVSEIRAGGTYHDTSYAPDPLATPAGAPAGARPRTQGAPATDGAGHHRSEPSGGAGTRDETGSETGPGSQATGPEAAGRRAPQPT